MSLAAYLRLMWRESRGAGRRFLFFVACLATGVAAIVCVAGLTASLDDRIRTEARKLLAADLAVRGLRPLPDDLDRFLQARPELETTRIRELVTMVARPAAGRQPGRSQLVELKVVDGHYPFYGELQIRPLRPLQDLLGDGQVVAAPDLMTRLQLKLGDQVKIGGLSFQIAGVVDSEPDRVATPFSLGPRVFMSASGFERTELEQLGSRILYRALIKITDDPSSIRLAALAEELRNLLGEAGPFRVETYADAQEELRRALQRAARFLGLVALLSLLLGGLGVTQTTRAWLASRMDDIAILRCMGLRPREVSALYLGQAAVLGIAGSLVGVVIGVAVQALVPHLFGEILSGVRLRLWQPAAVGRGFALGLGVALLFSLRALLTVRRVPPLRVLRKDVEPLPRGWLADLATFGLLAAGLWAIASVQAASPIRGLQFAAGIVLAASLLAGTGLAGIRALAEVGRRTRRVWLRHGYLGLARPGAGTLSAIVSLGLGVLLILGLELVKDHLSEELQGGLPLESPTAFLLNIQPDQWSEVQRLLETEGARRIDSVPFVTARLRAIDGRDVSQLIDEDGERHRRWALTREQRLTYMEELPADNRIVAGSPWSDAKAAEVSVEEEFARDLGAELGSVLSFDIQGVALDLEVTSVRSVEWRTFGINFFLVVEPGVLESAPQQRVATARLAPDREQRIQDLLADRFHNITLLRIREVLERVATVLGYLTRSVAFIGAFTVIAGIVILAGGVSADSVRRRKHIALLKTLGMTQRQVGAMLSVEFTVVGLIAGAIGAVGANLLSWAVVTRGLEIDWSLRIGTTLAALAVTALLTAATGVLASRQALRQRPAEVFRSE